MKRSRLIPLLLVVVLLAACGKNVDKAKLAALDAGNIYAARKQFSAATIEYRKALQLDSRFGEAHYRLAIAYDQLGDRPNALREFTVAADLLPDRDDVLLKAGQYMLFARRFDEARKIGLRLVDRSRRNVEAQLLLANAYASLDQLDAAEAQVEEAIRTDPSRDVSYTNLAAIQIAAGNPEKAEQAFKNAIGLDPNSIDARVGLANLCWSTGKLNDAERLLKEALAIQPASVLANRTLAFYYLSTGRRPEAEAPLKVVAANQKDAIPPRLALADYYLASRRVDEGVALLEAVAAQPGGLGPATERLADFEYKTGKQAAAHARVDRLIAAEPKNPLGYLMKSAFLSNEGQQERALARAREAAAVAPRLARAQYAMGMIHLRMRDTAEAASAFDEAIRLSPRMGLASLELAKFKLQMGASDEAVQRARDAVRDLPSSVEARYVLVRTLMNASQHEVAQRELAPLLAAFPRLPRVRTLAGLLALQRGDKTAAREAFDAALKLDPGENEAIASLVSLDLQEGLKIQARRRIEARMKVAPQDAGAAAIAARLYEALDSPKEAEAAWTRVVDLDPSQMVAYESLARLYLAERRPDEALAQCERITQRNPRSVSGHTLAGLVLEAEGRKADARVRYLKALEIDPKSPMAANNLAWLYAEGGDNLDTALQLAQTARSAHPEAPEVNDTLGWVAYRKGLYDMAVDTLEQAVRLAPDRPVYHYHLGMAYLKANDWPKARVSLQEALKRGLGSDNADEAQRALASIR